uniref:GH18 domain-containing protein n=1 Tax=Timema tahoe TaxID=61484 RepID=A0A7R9INQ9_9NEOP|nr:unnamed protein product [Timema tahoe]
MNCLVEPPNWRQCCNDVTGKNHYVIKGRIANCLDLSCRTDILAPSMINWGKPIATSLKVVIYSCLDLICRATKVVPGRVVCYFASWSLTRTGDSQYRIEDIDPYLCTHVIYAFANLASDGTIQVSDPSTDSSTGLGIYGYNRLNRLKQQNPNLKTLIAVGGGSAGSAIFSQVFNNAALRAAFVAFADTLVALRNSFNPLGLILTVACPSPSYYIRVSYDITRIAQNVDFINLMTYDFHNGYQSTTGLNAPLYVRQTDPDKELNVYAGVENWLNNGAPAEKIVLGMGFYGTAFILTDPSNNGVGAPASGAGGSGGTLMYNQICQSQMVDDGWNINWDDEADVPFANRGTLWVGYDDPDSIAEKAQYALDKGLGGAMVWSIDMDDFSGNCGDKNILLQKIKGIIG